MIKTSPPGIENVETSTTKAKEGEGEEEGAVEVVNGGDHTIEIATVKDLDMDRVKLELEEEEEWPKVEDKVDGKKGFSLRSVCVRNYCTYRRITKKTNKQI